MTMILLKKLASRLVVLLIATCLLLFMLELAARLLLPRPAFKTNLPFYPYVVQERQVQLPGVTPNSHYSTNRWGMRGSDPPENWEAAFTIITVGGSTTYDYYLDDANTWSAVLEAQLQQTNPEVWVGNAGLDGHSTRGHLKVMNEVVRVVQPDAVILLVGINDLTLSFLPNYSQEYDDKEANPLTRSQLFNVLWRVKQIAIDGVYVVDEVGGYDKFTPQVIPPDADLTPLPADLRDLLPSLPAYRQNLEAIIALAKEMNLQIMFLTQPALFEDSPAWENIWGRGFWVNNQSLAISAATWGAMLEIFNQELLAVCQAQGVLCYDLAAHIEHSDENFYDFVHFNDGGAAQVGAQVAEVVKDAWLENSP